MVWPLLRRSLSEVGPSGRPASAPPQLAASRSRQSAGADSGVSGSTLEDFYTVLEPLGSGAFATVHRAVENATGRTVAVKLIRVPESRDGDRHSAPLPDRGPRTPSVKNKHSAAEREYNLNCRVHRKAASTKRELFAAPHAAFATDTEYAMVLDYLGGGSLEHWVQANGKLRDGRRVMSEADAKVVLSRCLKAIRAMHAANCSHCDIKPANLVLAEEGDLSTVRVVDLGLATDNSRFAARQRYRGTPQYFAPELVRACRWGRPFGPAVDTWAAGVTLYVLLSGELPFEGDSCENLFRAILGKRVEFNGPVWDGVSDEAKDLIQRLLEKDEELRVKPRAALRHAWFRETKAPKPAHAILQRLFGPTRAFGQKRNTLGSTAMACA